MACGHGTLSGPLVDSGNHAFARSDCKSLHCRHCGDRKVARYHRRVSKLALEHKLQRFITLTLNPADVGIREEGHCINPASVDYIRETWAKMRVYLGRQFPKMKFIAVLEFQQKSTGNAHLHVLVNMWVSKEWLRESWKAVGGGMTWIKFADVHRIPQYLSKYMTKDLMGECPRRKRVITTSRNLQLTESPRNPGWTYSQKSVEFILDTLPKSILPLISTILRDDRGLLYFELLPDPETPF